MPDILDDIDAVIGLCPCGADPRPGSRHCSYDCEPTHRGVHTTADHDGTQMRWRPDLVTAADDSDLYDLGTMTWYTGRNNARLYQRGIPEQDQPTTWHLRLDDGHRYVGLDMTLAAPVDVLADDHEQRMTDAWQRLDRELGNHRHTERPPLPGNLSRLEQMQAQADRQRHEHTRSRIRVWLTANGLDPHTIPTDSTIRIRDGQICVREMMRNSDGQLMVDGGELVTAPRTVPLLVPWPDGLHYEHLERHDQVSVHAAAAIAAGRAADIVAARMVNTRSILRQITSA